MLCFKFLTVLCLCINFSASVIYRLNESDYALMPPVYHEDGREWCSDYCAVELEVFQNQPSDLYRMMLEYSKHTPTHYNHTQLWYGVCVSKRCPNYTANKTKGLKQSLEACLNETMVRDYGLQAKIKWHRCDNDIELSLDAGDVVVAAVVLVFIILTVAGTVQEIFVYTKKKEGNTILKCFSLPRNIMSLLGPPTVIVEEARNFNVFYGTRLILIFHVIGFHTFIPFFLKTDDARTTEMAYSSIQYLCNGTVLVQLLLVLSGMLLSYSLQKAAEKRPMNCSTLVKGIFLRWIRLTPPYAITLGILTTWLRFFELLAGPTWKWTLGQTISDCRRDWWMVLLHLVNYMDDSRCMIETWYVACDMQLTIIALLVLVLTRGRWRLLTLGLLFISSSAAIAFHTYLQDLDGAMIISPETVRRYIVVDETYQHVYQRTHTNAPAYIAGVVTGLLVYELQNSDIKMENYKKYGFILWLCFPVGLAIIMAGSVFYADAPRAPLLARVAWAVLHKVIFALLAAIGYIMLVFKLENGIRRFLGWRLWVTPARLSYSAYLVHFTLMSLLTAFITTPLHYSELHIFGLIVVVEILSFIAAVPLWILVEAPISKVVRLAIASRSFDSQPKKSAI